MLKFVNEVSWIKSKVKIQIKKDKDKDQLRY